MPKTIPRKCKKCGADFLALPHQVKIGKALYCSHVCSNTTKRSGALPEPVRKEHGEKPIKAAIFDDWWFGNDNEEIDDRHGKKPERALYQPIPSKSAIEEFQRD